MTYKDRTFCGSTACKDKCNRRLTDEDLSVVIEKNLLVSFSEFCDEDGELIQEEETDIEQLSRDTGLTEKEIAEWLENIRSSGL